jgi:hypothetical protein
MTGAHVDVFVDLVAISIVILQTLQSKIPLSHEVVLNHGAKAVRVFPATFVYKC